MLPPVEKYILSYWLSQAKDMFSTQFNRFMKKTLPPLTPMRFYRYEQIYGT